MYAGAVLLENHQKDFAKGPALRQTEPAIMRFSYLSIFFIFLFRGNKKDCLKGAFSNRNRSVNELVF